MMRTLNLVELNKLNSLCQSQSFRDIFEHSINNVESTYKPFGYDARENVVRGIPRS